MTLARLALQAHRQVASPPNVNDGPRTLDIDVANVETVNSVFHQRASLGLLVSKSFDRVHLGRSDRREESKDDSDDE